MNKARKAIIEGIRIRVRWLGSISFILNLLLFKLGLLKLVSFLRGCTDVLQECLPLWVAGHCGEEKDVQVRIEHPPYIGVAVHHHGYPNMAVAMVEIEWRCVSGPHVCHFWQTHTQTQLQHSVDSIPYASNPCSHWFAPPCIIAMCYMRHSFVDIKDKGCFWGGTHGESQCLKDSKFKGLRGFH